jgi:hypothetical protein
MVRISPKGDVHHELRLSTRSRQCPAMRRASALRICGGFLRGLRTAPGAQDDLFGGRRGVFFARCWSAVFFAAAGAIGVVAGRSTERVVVSPSVTSSLPRGRSGVVEVSSFGFDDTFCSPGAFLGARRNSRTSQLNIASYPHSLLLTISTSCNSRRTQARVALA